MRILYGITFACLFCFSAANGVADTIIFQDSFENPATTVGSVVTPTGWTVVGQADAWYAKPGSFNSIPDGNQVAYSNGGTLTYTLPTTLAPDSTYLLTVDAGFRQDCDAICTTFSPVIQLFAGDVLLATATGSTPQRGDWALWTASYTSGSSKLNIGQNLRIVLGTGASDPATAFMPQTNFDAVRLSSVSTPEPGSLTLLAIGGIAFIASRRIRH